MLKLFMRFQLDLSVNIYSESGKSMRYAIEIYNLESSVYECNEYWYSVALDVYVLVHVSSHTCRK